jgi:ABC-2 type transport system permease protein
MAPTSLGRRTFGSDLRALLAIAGKEWTIFRRYPSWILAFFIWPVLFPFGYIYSARALAGPDSASLATFSALAGTSDYISYIVVGSTLWMWLNMTLWDIGFNLRNEQMRGTLESNWLTPTWRGALMLGSSLTKLGTSLVFLLIAAIEFKLVFNVNLVGGNPWLILLLLVLVIPIIYGIGIIFACLVLRFKEANPMVVLVRGIFMIFCGITFPVAVLPGWMNSVAAFLPLTYAIHAVRAVALSNATFLDIWPDVRALLLFAVVLPLLGYLAFTLIERRSRRSGDLGQY